MKIEVTDIKSIGFWSNVYDLALKTLRKNKHKAAPSDVWKKKILLAEHSPIRVRTFQWTWKDLPYWVSNHFVRHKHGIEHFVTTQRTDKTGVNRNELPQNAPVNHTCIANAQALINISRKRLCNQSALYTKTAWGAVKKAINDIDPIMASCMVPECVYRGFCPEIKSCGFNETEDYYAMLEEYRNTQEKLK